ncbi:hypothetical protein V8E55_009764 [Tylopilus felleus]
MGFFDHRIHPHFLTERQALARLSTTNDNDRLVVRMVSLSLLPSLIPDDIPCWDAEEDERGAKLWDIEQAVRITERDALVIGGCRASAIRWKNPPQSLSPRSAHTSGRSPLSSHISSESFSSLGPLYNLLFVNLPFLLLPWF